LINGVKLIYTDTTHELNPNDNRKSKTINHLDLGN